MPAEVPIRRIRIRILLARLTGRALDDPALGLLLRRGDWWIRDANGTVALSLLSPRGTPDPDLLRSAASALERLDGLEARARSYIGATRGPNAATGLTLVGVAVLRPSPDWITRELASRTAAAAATLNAGSPAISLQFRGEAERGVLHVTLVDGVPVEADHH